MASEEFIRANFSEEMNDKFYDNYDELIDDRTIDNESICDNQLRINWLIYKIQVNFVILLI